MDPNADGGHPNVLLPLHATLTYGHWNWADKVPKAIKLLLQVPLTVSIRNGQTHLLFALEWRRTSEEPI
jgi:hypothetical protein